MDGPARFSVGVGGPDCGNIDGDTHIIGTVPSRLLDWIGAPLRSGVALGQPPLRAELFSGEQLARHGALLAAGHRVVTDRGSNSLLGRLGQNEEILRTFNHATLTVDKTRRVTPAAEWLLDNFYLIEEQIHLARRHLPRGYSRELPRLVNGPSAGLPRIYDVVIELISHVDAQIDAGPLQAFVASYQTVASLKLGAAPAQGVPDSRLTDRSDKPRIVPKLKVTTALLNEPSELMLNP